MVTSPSLGAGRRFRGPVAMDRLGRTCYFCFTSICVATDNGPKDASDRNGGLGDWAVAGVAPFRMGISDLYRLASGQHLGRRLASVLDRAVDAIRHIGTSRGLACVLPLVYDHFTGASDGSRTYLFVPAAAIGRWIKGQKIVCWALATPDHKCKRARATIP